MTNRRHPLVTRLLAGAAIAVVAPLISSCAGHETTTDRLPDEAPLAATPDTDIFGGAPPHSTRGTIVLPRATTAPASGTTIVPGAKPEIASLHAPPDLRCAGRGEATARVDYETHNVDRVAFALDGRQVAGTPSVSGQVEIAIPCDGHAHVLLLTAAAPDNQTVVDSRAIIAR